MKRWILITVIFMALTACIADQTQGMLEPASTDMRQVNISNPALVYCQQNGNTLEIVTATDGSQSGICVLADDSSCDEWAFHRGEWRNANLNA